MNIRQLRYFVVLAQELSFTRAAERLHISQPPLSRQIAQLEATLGVQLFRRSSRRVELTESGEAFLFDVQHIFENLRQATQRAQAIDQGLEGRIDIGLSGSHFMGRLPRLMAQYRQAYPNVVLTLNEMVPAQQVHALMERRIDVNISRIPVHDNIVHSVSLWSDPVVVAMPQGHPLAAQNKLKVSDLRNEKLILLRQNTSVFAQTVHQHCLAAGLLKNIVQTVSEVPAQVYLVAADIGVAIVPLSVCTRFDEVSWAYLDEPDIRTDVYAVMRRETSKRALDTFINVLKNSCHTT